MTEKKAMYLIQVNGPGGLQSGYTVRVTAAQLRALVARLEENPNVLDYKTTPMEDDDEKSD